jgi:peptide/nickel transport system permease protein
MPEPSPSGAVAAPDATPDAAPASGGAADILVTPLVVDTAPIAVEVEVARTKRLGIMGWAAIGWLGAVVLSALFAPILPIPGPTEPFFDKISQGPQPGHPFGLDSNGYDMFSRVIWGARPSLLISVSSIVVGLIVGGALGLVAGYYRGKADLFLTNLFNVFLAIPQLVLALALVAVFATGDGVTVAQREFWLIVSIAIVSIPILGRITRASSLSWAQREFVLAGRAMGARNKRVMVRDVLPNVLPAMFSIALLGIAVVIVIEGGLSILGVGVPADTPSWGNLIATGRNELTKYVGSAPWVILAPSIVIFLTVLSLNYLGDVVRARFDVREAAI